MSIFGHMTANSPIKGPEGTSGDDAPPTTSSGDELSDFTSATVNDLEETLARLSDSIEETITGSTVEKEKEEEVPHFTAASSPTRTLHKKDD